MVAATKRRRKRKPLMTVYETTSSSVVWNRSFTAVRRPAKTRAMPLERKSDNGNDTHAHKVVGW